MMTPLTLPHPLLSGKDQVGAAGLRPIPQLRSLPKHSTARKMNPDAVRKHHRGTLLRNFTTVSPHRCMLKEPQDDDDEDYDDCD